MLSISLPFSITVPQMIGLCAIAFTAGFIDSIAGGGGLIQLPGIMAFLPNVPVVTLLAVNKTSSMLGTITAVTEYTRKGMVNVKRMWKSALIAFFSSAMGAFAAKRVPNELLKPLIVILLACLILFTLLKKDFGQHETVSRFSPAQQAILGLLLGLLIGFYDGFFGPGTGNLLIMGLIFIYGEDFLHASADAKTVNAMTNIAAFTMYTMMGVGNILLGVTMGLFNMAGAHLGVRLAVLKGSRFIRILFIIMSCGLLLKQIIELF
ncbi:MAG: TSUP family transporter [Anaerolineaceae bacterium]|nr:TSUP family transporter [Anaerolineaceae bacterium]